MTVDWARNPDDHVYCGKRDCWKKFNSTEFKDMEAKVVCLEYFWVF